MVPLYERIVTCFMVCAKGLNQYYIIEFSRLSEEKNVKLRKLLDFYRGRHVCATSIIYMYISYQRMCVLFKYAERETGVKHTSEDEASSALG